MDYLAQTKEDWPKKQPKDSSLNVLVYHGLRNFYWANPEEYIRTDKEWLHSEDCLIFEGIRQALILDLYNKLAAQKGSKK